MRISLFIIISLISSVTNAQRVLIADSIGYNIIQQSEKTFPKFYREFQYIKMHDSLIRKINFIDEVQTGPAFASPQGIITFNIEYFKHPKPNFDDNRLIVVLYHEIGHLHYYVTTYRTKWNPENSEKAAFEYSLLKTKQLAENGDCMPLITGVKFMKLRSESNDLKDAHVRALKRMVNEPLYSDYVKYVNTNCK